MKMRRTILILFAVALPVLVLAVILPRSDDDAQIQYKANSREDNAPIVLECYVGENMVKPMAEIASVFEERHPGVSLEYHDSGTTSLDKVIRETETGDLFLPG